MIAQTKHKLKNTLYNKGLKDLSLYTPQEKVMAELHRRRALITDDSQLLEVIKPTPSIQRLIDRPHLVFFRQIATPLHETLRVIEIAKELGLELCFLEYHDDKMVGAQNFFKHALGKLPVHQFVDKKGDDIIQNRTVIDFNQSNGHPIREIKTIRGEPLIHFHHTLLAELSDVDISSVAVDASDWFVQFEAGAAQYYEAFFSLFVTHSVLAEVFLDGDSDKGYFTKKIVAPSFDRVSNRNGFHPLILNYQPASEQSRLYWDCYPNVTDDLLSQKEYID